MSLRLLLRAMVCLFALLVLVQGHASEKDAFFREKRPPNMGCTRGPDEGIDVGADTTAAITKQPASLDDYDTF